MKLIHNYLTLQTNPKSLNQITYLVESILEQSNLQNGLINVFCKHTSCSLVMMENADPSAQSDLEQFMDRLVPEGDPNFTHTFEGKDDMPSHIKMALTRTNETIPFSNGQLLLGTWQGIFLWEHRSVSHSRELVVTIYGD
jgi:secondary thiamine-phosphate synthase enzyme